MIYIDTDGILSARIMDIARTLAHICNASLHMRAVFIRNTARCKFVQWKDFMLQ